MLKLYLWYRFNLSERVFILRRQYIWQKSCVIIFYYYEYKLAAALKINMDKSFWNDFFHLLCTSTIILFQVWLLIHWIFFLGVAWIMIFIFVNNMKYKSSPSIIRIIIIYYRTLFSRYCRVHIAWYTISYFYWKSYKKVIINLSSKLMYDILY